MGEPRFRNHVGSLRREGGSEPGRRARGLRGRRGRELPVDLSEGEWDDLEQGWWARVIATGGEVYIAETDFDALLDASERTLALVRPGLVTAGDVEIRWSRVQRNVYDDAWRRAIAELEPR